MGLIVQHGDDEFQSVLPDLPGRRLRAAGAGRYGCGTELAQGAAMRKNLVVPVLVHSLPLVPLALGYGYAAIATVLLVALTYIKTRKLEATMVHLEGLAPVPPSAAATRELNELRRAIALWRAMTFLPKPV
jgi:hypothetical protein